MEWETSNKKYATVKNGVVTAKKTGKGKTVTLYFVVGCDKFLYNDAKVSHRLERQLISEKSCNRGMFVGC